MREGSEHPAVDGDADVPIGPVIYPLIAGTLGASMAWSLAPNVGTRDLYVVAAQIIPVLLLALALEVRLFRTVDPFAAHHPTQLLDDVARVKRDLTEFRMSLDAQTREVAKLKAEADALERNAVAADEVEDAVLEKVAHIHKQLAEVGAERSEHRAAVQRWIVQVDEQEKRLKRLTRPWRITRAGWQGSRTIHVAVGVVVLAFGEFEALVRISDGTFDASPRFAFAAVGYGFSALLVAALIKR